jgi:hypothetical protein
MDAARQEITHEKQTDKLCHVFSSDLQVYCQKITVTQHIKDHPAQNVQKLTMDAGEGVNHKKQTDNITF